MLVQYVSDLHLELLSHTECETLLSRLIPVAPILLLLGNIGNPYHNNYTYFLKKISNKFEKIFIIAGSHEYYSRSHTIEETDRKIEAITRDISPSGRIRYLQRSYEDYNGFRWVGMTLWTEIQTRKEHSLYSIKDFTNERYRELYKESLDWLTNELNDVGRGEKNQYSYIILTHHLPSYSLISSETFDDQHNEWIASHLDHLIIRHKDKLNAWFYGISSKPKRSYMTIKAYDPPPVKNATDIHIALTKYGKTSSIAFLCNPAGKTPNYIETWDLK